MVSAPRGTVREGRFYVLRRFAITVFCANAHAACVYNYKIIRAALEKRRVRVRNYGAESLTGSRTGMPRRSAQGARPLPSPGPAISYSPSINAVSLSGALH